MTSHDHLNLYPVTTDELPVKNTQKYRILILKVDVILEKVAEALTHCTFIDNSTAMKSK